MLNMGMHLAGGSDSPYEKLNPLFGIYAAVTRKGLDEKPEQGFIPEETLTVEEALGLFTKGAAYASFEENIKGTITEGKLADMVVLSEDIFSTDPMHIKDVEVLATIVGGKVEYSKGEIC